jgi:hypothetical protein
MKRLILFMLLIPMICLADPTATPEPTVTPTPTPTPVVRTVPVSSVVTIGTGSTRVMSAEALGWLIALTLINDSDEVQYLNVTGGVAAVNTGIRLNANGGSVTYYGDQIPRDGIQAICASGSKKLLVSGW